MGQGLWRYRRSSTGGFCFGAEIKFIVVIVLRIRCQIIFMHPGQDAILLNGVIIPTIQIFDRKPILTNRPTDRHGHVGAVSPAGSYNADDVISALNSADICGGNGLDNPICGAILLCAVLNDIDCLGGEALGSLKCSVTIRITGDSHRAAVKGEFGTISQRDFTTLDGDRLGGLVQIAGGKQAIQRTLCRARVETRHEIFGECSPTISEHNSVIIKRSISCCLAFDLHKRDVFQIQDSLQFRTRSSNIERCSQFTL